MVVVGAGLSLNGNDCACCSTVFSGIRRSSNFELLHGIDAGDHRNILGAIRCGLDAVYLNGIGIFPLSVDTKVELVDSARACSNTRR